MKKIVKHIDSGLSSYEDVWSLQKSLKEKKIKGDEYDYIITVEHLPVYTLGRSGNRDHLLIDSRSSQELGVSYIETDRGGDITFHGPGQLVVYPILDLSKYYKDVHRFLRDLEEVVIVTLSRFGISGNREEKFTGVWVDDKKICAIGINVSRWITMHGLALNVNTDLSYFKNIIPCGIFHKDVTSMKEILGRDQNMKEVMMTMMNSFEEVFECEIVE
ncbi:MAG: lipoyl(octanoyl) transferase LipB [Ignavibacteria bacterium]|nr:lipoyl(octanoyl) transferase LipB [Ignavibacteria bacterium]